MRYWTFDPNTCRFERASKQAALHAADVAVVLVMSGFTPVIASWAAGAYALIFSPSSITR